MAANSSKAPRVADNDIWERDRLAALQRFDVLDSPREEAFDRITGLIRSIFGVRVGIVSMIDAHRQWYKSVVGLPTSEASRNETFCRFTLAAGAPVIVPDATLDPRFADSPHVTGEPHVRFYAGVPLLTSDGHTIGTLCAIDFVPREFSDRETKILEDLALMTMSELELRQRATIDVLTGTLSRRAFKDEGARAVALAARHTHTLSCVAFDLDHFKAVNDKFGHAAGDKVLVGVTKACMGLLRSSDLIGRLGGEEFAILLPHTDRSSAFAVAEKLRATIEGLSFVFSGQPVRVSASFGVSASNLATVDIDTLLEHADIALYEAKAAGRNRCVEFGRQVATPKSPLRRVLKAGTMIFNGRASVVDCTVRAISDEGARLDVTSSLGIPDRFRLGIRSDGFDRDCRILQRAERHLEVEFA